jgi:uncharacterized protein (UPF0276 family)
MLGVGIGYRPVFQATLFEHREEIDFLEIIADHYFDSSSTKRAELELLKNNFPLVPHGLALSLGSAEGIAPSYLRSFAKVVERVQPAWCSDHIAFTRAGGVDIGHLTAIPKTRASLQVLKKNIQRVRDAVDVPLILENITESLRYPGDEFSDAEFLGEICEQNDIGLLLDVTNLYMNSLNHGYCALGVLERLPADRIVQLHFSGGHLEDGIWVDSHSRETPSEIWDLLGEVLSRASVRGVVLERDENIPPLRSLIPELQAVRRLLSIAEPPPVPVDPTDAGGQS